MSLGLWQSLLWPLLRLLLAMAFGLLLANALEALNWTRPLGRLAAPLARCAHLGQASASAFALSFFSPQGANGLLSDARREGRISRKELILANIFNSLPAYLTHAPTIFFLTWPILGTPALIYLGLTFLAALGRTILIVVLGRFFLPTPKEAAQAPQATAKKGPLVWTTALNKAWRRFLRRLPRLVLFTAPIYILMYYLQREGFFSAVELWLAAHLDWLSFLKPQAMGIIALHFAAELGAALGAAASLLAAGGLSSEDVILALLVGNILSTPVRALRHQLPAYAGFYSPGLALLLLCANQGLRAASLALITLIYWLG